MGESEQVDVRFRLADGSDFGPMKYALSSTIEELKASMIERWPQEKKIVPKGVNDLRLIYAGKVLDNKQKLSEARSPLSELPAMPIIMHVVVCVPLAVAKKKADKMLDEMPKEPACSCAVM